MPDITTDRRWDRPYQVVRVHYGGGITVVSGHRTYRGAELWAAARDLALMISTRGARPRYAYDVRATPEGIR